MEPPRIAVFSIPLVSTWVLDDTHRILFDAGDGVSAMLDARIHRIRHVALTHAHRDHCAGLLQLLNLTGGDAGPTVAYPAGSGAARALSGFLSSFDARTTGRLEWKPLVAGEQIEVEPARHVLRAFATRHYPEPNPPRCMSLGYQIVREVDKLRPEFHGMAREDLIAVRNRHGKSFITETFEDVLLSVTGDTMRLDPALFRGSRALVHECTFLGTAECREMAQKGHPHSSLDEVLETAHDAQVQHLALYHISRRYEDGLIRSRVRDLAAKMRLPCTVSVALPGRVYDNVFADFVWRGTDEGQAGPDV